MTNRNRAQLSFPGCKGRKVEAEFSGGNVTSDAGVLLVRQADHCLGLTASVADLLEGPRRRVGCEHTGLSMLRRSNFEGNLLISNGRTDSRICLTIWLK